MWFEELVDAIHSLAVNPELCVVAPEDPELRQLLYGRSPNVYRVIFRILEKPKKIVVLHIRHGAQQPFKAADLN